MSEDARYSEDADWEIEENLLQKFSAGSFFNIIQDAITPAEDDEELAEIPPSSLATHP